MAVAIENTKKFKALIAVGLSHEQALVKLGKAPAPVDPQAEALATLIEGGFTEEQARGILADQAPAKGKKAKAEPAKTASQLRDELIAQHGFDYTRGRVYTNPDVIEAQVRVGKTGKMEVVQTSGNGHVPAVLIYRTDSGDIAVQNLHKV